MKFNIEKIHYYLPGIPNQLEDFKNENPNWDLKKIFEKSGVSKIYKSSDDTFEFLKNAFKFFTFDDLSNIDVLIVVNQTAEIKLPSLSNLMQNQLKIKQNVIAFDMGLGCSGFIYALYTALKLLDSEEVKKALVVMCDNYSHYINKNDRTMLPLFSDCVSAVKISNDLNHRIIDYDFGSDGSGGDSLKLTYNKSKNKELFMNGSNVFMFTMSRVPESVRKILQKNNLKNTDIDFYLFHQASQIVLDNLKRNLNLSDNKILISLNNFGNTIASTIPILLSEHYKKFKKGDKIILCGFGVGLSWGTLLVEW